MIIIILFSLSLFLEQNKVRTFLVKHHYCFVFQACNMVESFYVVLPSNASLNTFPNNKIHTFKTKIASELPCDKGEWTVGLTEISFPTSWPNLIGGSISLKFRQDSSPLQFMLPDGVYRSVDELLKVINGILKNADVKDEIVIYHDAIRNRVLLLVRESQLGFGVSFSKNIANILGLMKSSPEYYTAGKYTELPADINDGMSSIYLYANICGKRLVGDTMVPLLRVIPTDPSNHTSSVKWVRFRNIEYVPVNRNNSDIIEINIRRDNGDIVPFESGKVVVTLHFRKTIQA